jgi:hypothetical protein
MGVSDLIFQLFARKPYLWLEKQELDSRKMGNSDQSARRGWDRSGRHNIRKAGLAKEALRGNLPPTDTAGRVYRGKNYLKELFVGHMERQSRPYS